MSCHELLLFLAMLDADPGPRQYRYRKLLLTEWLPKFDLVKVRTIMSRASPIHHESFHLIGVLTEQICCVRVTQVSDADLAFLYNCKEAELDLDVIAAEWLSAAPNCPLLLITRGSEGTVAYRKQAPKIVVALNPVEVVDTVRRQLRRIKLQTSWQASCQASCCDALQHYSVQQLDRHTWVGDDTETAGVCECRSALATAIWAHSSSHCGGKASLVRKLLHDTGRSQLGF